MTRSGDRIDSPIASSFDTPLDAPIAAEADRRVLIDRFGRVHRSLRLSVTDRCNIRCFYCMPDEAIRFRRRAELLTDDEFARFVSVAARWGIERVRITGGEPLLRERLDRLVALLRAIPGIRELALTTNGMLLADQARGLRDAGLDRINISLDTLDPETFREIARRDGLERTLAGIDAALDAGFPKIRLNAVAIAGLIERDAVPLVEFARARGLEMRFIEFMPLDGDRNWTADRVVPGERLRQRIEAALGPLEPIERSDPAQPAVDWRFADRSGVVGFIEPVSRPFCGACDRLRLTAEGQVRNCLFSTVEWDARALLRGGGSDQVLGELLRDCTAAKRAGHGIDSPAFERPERAMYQIGG